MIVVIVVVSVVILVVVSVLAIFLFVNGNVFFAARTAFTIVFVDLDLFPFVLSPVLTTWKRCREGRVTSFVTFPSDALLYLSFYLHLSPFFNSVAPVRRREDTKGDRDSGVKVLNRNFKSASLLSHSSWRGKTLVGKQEKGLAPVCLQPFEARVCSEKE